MVGAPLQLGVFWGAPPEKFGGSEKCILVDPGDRFTMDNGESKKPLRSDNRSFYYG